MQASRSVKRIPSLLAVVLVLAGMAPRAAAEVRVNRLFADHMVLQRDVSVPVWGTAAPAETVRVSLAGEQASGVADAQGRWRVALAQLHGGGPYQLTIAATNTIRFEDVWVGDVWLCSGQSNMEWALGRSIGGPQAVAASAGKAPLRLCTIPHNSHTVPQDDVPAKWVVPGPESTPHFSAIAYWFGARLQRELGVPVGIINDSYGGTTIQSWMPLDILRRGPWPQDKATDIDLSKADYEQRKAKIQPAMDQYLRDKAAASKARRPQPPFPAGWPGEFRGPSVLWNGMLAPLLPFRLRGVLWYQGESNAYVGVSGPYRDLLPAMIRAWREGFAQPELPFVVFQLSAFRKPQVAADEPSGIAELREYQARACRNTPHTTLVVTLDLGEPDVHYKNKEPAAGRAVQAALGMAYGRPGEYASPHFQQLTIEGPQARIRLAHAGSGLIARGGPPRGFAVAGADRRFVFAEARMDGQTIVVHSPNVNQPVAVRYAWADLPPANVFSREGLPLEPFRTDDWPLPAR